MRKLDRAAVPAPACLAAYSHPAQRWDDVTGEHKQHIRVSLEGLQGRRCAYCEGDVDALGQHIEHFRRKKRFPELTFAWENLYWSCDQSDSCGHYKDHGAGPYEVHELLAPCVDEPDKFFRFRSDGTITVRPGLTPAEARRAEETLRVFGLNPRWGRLRNMRRAAVSGYVQMADGAADVSPEFVREFFADEIALCSTLSFGTAVRHVLTEP